MSETTAQASWAVEEVSTGIVAARGYAPTVEGAAREAARYATQYAEDGPVKWWVKDGRKKVIQGRMARREAA